MNSLIIYHTIYGNTRKLAEAMCTVLGRQGPVQVVNVTAVSHFRTQGVDLIVIGSPTHGRGIPPAMRQFLDRLPDGALRGANVAIFDLRYRRPKLWTGSAADKMVWKLGRLGGRLLVPAESFFIAGSEGPLARGELERAQRWAQDILTRVTARRG
jgi:flavodoxin